MLEVSYGHPSSKIHNETHQCNMYLRTIIAYQEVCQRLAEHHQTLSLLKQFGSGKRTEPDK